MIYDKNFILDELKQRLTLKDRILMHFFKDYTQRLYIKGINKGYDWDFQQVDKIRKIMYNKTYSK